MIVPKRRLSSAWPISVNACARRASAPGASGMVTGLFTDRPCLQSARYCDSLFSLRFGIMSSPQLDIMPNLSAPLNGEGFERLEDGDCLDRLGRSPAAPTRNGLSYRAAIWRPMTLLRGRRIGMSPSPSAVAPRRSCRLSSIRDLIFWGIGRIWLPAPAATARPGLPCLPKRKSA